VWRDWALVAVLVPTAVLEGLLRDDVMWRPVSLALGVGLAWTLLWRPHRPAPRGGGGFRCPDRAEHREPGQRR
jgi:hypothetical protein